MGDSAPEQPRRISSDGAKVNQGTNTLREIFHQPEVWAECLGVLDAFDLQTLVGEHTPQTHEWIFTGCGTSYYLALAAAYTFTELTGRVARAVPASEILLASSLVFPREQGPCFPVLISRSGRTSEVLRAGELLRSRGIEFLGVTCDGNDLLDLTPRVIKLPVAEQSTVMTSSFTSMLLALQYLAGRLTGNEAWIDSLHALPGPTSALLKLYGAKVEEFARHHFDDAVILAQGALYPIAEEISLKVMESSSSYAQFFHTLEFRHGPKSIVSEKTLVAALLSEGGNEAESAVLLEMKDLGARTLAIGNRISPALRSKCDMAIELDLRVPELARLIVYAVWGQLLGAYAGIHKGLDPDHPHNLTRVVTLGADEE